MMVHKDWDSSDSKLPWFQIRGACSKWANLPSVLGSCCDVFSLVPTIESIPPWRPWATAQPQRTAKSIQAHHTQNHPRKKDALHQFNPISGWALGPRLLAHTLATLDRCSHSVSQQSSSHCDPSKGCVYIELRACPRPNIKKTTQTTGLYTGDEGQIGHLSLFLSPLGSVCPLLSVFHTRVHMLARGREIQFSTNFLTTYSY